MLNQTEPEAQEIEEQGVQLQKILVVDDDEQILKAIKRTLRSVLCDVHLVSTGTEAIRLIHQQEFAVVICDEHMPEINGVQVLQKAMEFMPDAIRVILTGDKDLNTVIQAINVGQISQFIVKPWDDTTLRQTVGSCIEKYRLLKENQKLQGLIYSQHKALAKNHEFLRHELKLGARIHEVLLLSRVPSQLPGFKIDAMTVPSRDIDGDFYDFYHPSGELFDVVIGDVMGKGIPAALVGTAVKTQLMRFAVPFSRSLVFEGSGIWHEAVLKPDEILSKVHQETASQLIDLGYFVSLFYARFNLKYRSVSYVDCGATKPLHYQASRNQIRLLKGTNFPLGMVEKDFYHVVETPFEKGDIFVFYSDGVTETKSPDNQLFGVQRLMDLLVEHSASSPTEMLRLIKHAVLTFGQKDHFDDDLTIIIVRIEEDLFPKTTQIRSAKFSSDLSQLKAMRNFIHAVCLQAPGNSTGLSPQLQLAINEVFCNIVKHGYGNEPGHEIAINVELSERGILVEVADQGIEFDPSKAPEPSLAGDRFHNFGLFIVKQVADQLTYVPKEFADGWNRLRLFKRYLWESKQMDVTHYTKDDVLVITLEGESLDAKEAPHFKEKVTDLLADQQMHKVVFDMQHLEFIDSSGLGSLLSILRLLNTQSGDLKLARVPDPIRTMFEIVRMHKLFEIFNSTDDAIRSFVP